MPLCIDTEDPEALGAALKSYEGKPLINSVNGEERSLEAVLPLVKEHGATVIGLCMDEDGIPSSADVRLKVMENLIMVKPRKGMFVADIAVTDLLQIFEMRVELESFATRLATQRINQDEMVELKNLAKEYQEVAYSSKEILINLDARFNYLLAKSSHNKFLIKEIGHLYNLSLRIWYIVLN